jgi:hypothetical protein
MSYEECRRIVREHIKLFPKKRTESIIDSIDKYDGYVDGHDLEYYDEDEVEKWLKELEEIIK